MNRIPTFSGSSSTRYYTHKRSLRVSKSKSKLSMSLNDIYLHFKLLPSFSHGQGHFMIFYHSIVEINREIISIEQKCLKKLKVHIKGSKQSSNLITN